MEISRLGVKLELGSNWSCSCWSMPQPQQRQIPGPLSEARDRTHILMDTSGIRLRCAAAGTPDCSRKSAFVYLIFRGPFVSSQGEDDESVLLLCHLLSSPSAKQSCRSPCPPPRPTLLLCWCRGRHGYPPAQRRAWGCVSVHSPSWAQASAPIACLCFSSILISCMCVHVCVCLNTCVCVSECAWVCICV